MLNISIIAVPTIMSYCKPYENQGVIVYVVETNFSNLITHIINKNGTFTKISIDEIENILEKLNGYI